MRTFIALAAAASLTLAVAAPTPALARDRDDYGYDRHYYDRDHHRRRHHDDDDDGAAIAAGVIGLALGVALGAMASSDNGARRADAYCTDNYQRCAPPPQSGYYEPQGGGYYAQDYGLEGGPVYRDGNACIIPTEQWDPVAGRYVVVNLRRPCD